MKEMLMSILEDYIRQLKENKEQCIKLMKEGKEWEELAKKGAGLKLMIETTIIEIAKYK